MSFVIISYNNNYNNNNLYLIISLRESLDSIYYETLYMFRGDLAFIYVRTKNSKKMFTLKIKRKKKISCIYSCAVSTLQQSLSCLNNLTIWSCWSVFVKVMNSNCKNDSFSIVSTPVIGIIGS